jgi:hypothetical protein
VAKRQGALEVPVMIKDLTGLCFKVMVNRKKLSGLENKKRRSEYMKVLITGDTGYIGSTIVPLFLQQGYSVTGLDSEWTVRKDAVQ